MNSTSPLQISRNIGKEVDLRDDEDPILRDDETPSQRADEFVNSILSYVFKAYKEVCCFKQIGSDYC